MISLPTLLTVLFVALKLTEVIDWSWWLVLSPTIATFFIYIAVIAFAGLYALKFEDETRQD